MNSPTPARAPRFPWITFSLSALTLAVWWIPAARELLQFDRTDLASGALWRTVTGHFTHWTSSHLAWDLAAFVLLGVLLERHSRSLLGITLAVSALAISGAVWLAAPELTTYRGLSGVDSALFAAVVTHAGIAAALQSRWGSALWPVLAAVAFTTKVVAESTAGGALFVAPDVLFVPVPLAHVAGGLTGLVVAVCYSSRAKAAQVVAAWPCGSPTGRLRSM